MRDYMNVESWHDIDASDMRLMKEGWDCSFVRITRRGPRSWVVKEKCTQSEPGDTFLIYRILSFKRKGPYLYAKVLWRPDPEVEMCTPSSKGEC
jgi:hypothetical protein